MGKVDWDIELVRAQARIDLKMTDDQIVAALNACLEVARALARSLAEVWADFVQVVLQTANNLESLGYSFLEETAPRPKSNPKEMWKTPRAQKRPPLFVVYNQVPQKRPLKGRRGRH